MIKRGEVVSREREGKVRGVFTILSMVCNVRKTKKITVLYNIHFKIPTPHYTIHYLVATNTSA